MDFTRYPRNETHFATTKFSCRDIYKYSVSIVAFNFSDSFVRYFNL
jgi:hypothetical protein